jgi:hypothetical protein
MKESEARIDDEDTTRTIQNSETVLSNGENGTEESEEDRPSRNLYDLSNYSDTETVNDKQYMKTKTNLIVYSQLN